MFMFVVYTLWHILLHAVDIAGVHRGRLSFSENIDSCEIFSSYTYFCPIQATYMNHFNQSNLFFTNLDLNCCYWQIYACWLVGKASIVLCFGSWCMKGSHIACIFSVSPFPCIFLQRTQWWGVHTCTHSCTFSLWIQPQFSELVHKHCK